MREVVRKACWELDYKIGTNNIKKFKDVAVGNCTMWVGMRGGYSGIGERQSHLAASGPRWRCENDEGPLWMSVFYLQSEVWISQEQGGSRIR